MTKCWRLALSLGARSLPVFRPSGIATPPARPPDLPQPTGAEGTDADLDRRLRGASVGAISRKNTSFRAAVAPRVGAIPDADSRPRALALLETWRHVFATTIPRTPKPLLL